MVSPTRLIERLREAGFTEGVINASLPDWWTPDSQALPSASTMVSMLLARRLSLDPESLLDDGVPIGFLHTGPTKFKHLRLEKGRQRDALTAFGQGVARMVLSGRSDLEAPGDISDPLAVRHALFKAGSGRVGFGDVLTLCWSVGVPVIHLRVFPARVKGVTAMVVRLADRYVILVARETGLPAQYMFHLAHELGHIALNHLKSASAIVDADEEGVDDTTTVVRDEEEEAADQYAQALLTGQPSFTVTTAGSRGTPRELARKAIEVGAELRIDPAHIVMTYGYQTKDWALAHAAAKRIADQQEQPGRLVNQVFWDQMRASADVMQNSFLRAVAAI